MKNYLDIANSFWLWLSVVPTIALVIYQALVFTKKVKEASVLVDLSESEIKRAFKIGAVSAIGPALGVFVVMIALSSKIGAPIAWLRLSIIGAAPTELAASEFAAQSMGTTLGAPDFSPTNFANIAWITALNGASWLFVSGVFADKLDTANKKITGGDPVLLGVLSVGAIIGVFGFMFANEIAKGLKPGNSPALVAGFAAAIVMIGLTFLTKKYPKLGEHTLGIAMIVGMAAAVIFTRMI